MRLSDCSIRTLLPYFMQEDAAIKGLADAFDAQIKRHFETARLQTTWDKLEQLPESELDLLASELHVTWYLHDATIDEKRRIIRNSDRVYSKLGTVFAVQEVINTYYGDGDVIEWFDYGGEPHHFSIESSNPSITTEAFARFEYVLNLVKRESSHLDGIINLMKEDCSLTYGFAVLDSTRERH